jgi:hypothetical protein
MSWVISYRPFFHFDISLETNGRSTRLAAWMGGMMTRAKNSKFVPIYRIVDGSSTKYGSSDRSYAQRESACMRQWERRQDFDRLNIRNWTITLGSAFDSSGGQGNLRNERKQHPVLGGEPCAAHVGAS